MGKRVFISYARADGIPHAEYIYNELSRAGHEPWMDKHGGIPPTEYWDQVIQKAINGSDVLVLILTPGSVKSDNCHDEWSYAMSKKKRIMPLMFKACEVPMRLHRVQYIDFQADTPDALDNMMRYIATGQAGNSPTVQSVVEAVAPVPTVSDVMRLESPPNTPLWLPVHAAEALLGDPPEPVQLPAYFIAKTPVTQGQYRRFVALSGHPAPDDDYLPDYTWTNDAPPADKTDHPVVLVSVADAEAYCAWLTKELRPMLAGLGEGWRVALPSAQEWYRAARGDQGQVYPWGPGGPSNSTGNHRGGGTSAVDAHPQGISPVGALDMGGNVWEWTRTERSNGDRVLKGGSWRKAEPDETARPAFVHSDSPDRAEDNYGFRPVVIQERS